MFELERNTAIKRSIVILLLFCNHYKYILQYNNIYCIITVAIYFFIDLFNFKFIITTTLMIEIETEYSKKQLC